MCTNGSKYIVRSQEPILRRAAREFPVVVLTGPRQSGKTTLLERIVAGDFKLGYGVEIGYFPQQEVHLDERGSVLDCLQVMTGLSRPKAQSLLGRFLFSGWEAHEKPVRALSGGERRRLALAVLVASGANFLILDEPTNHLDLESREALEAALEAFSGTVLLVSHDRALIDAVAHRTAAVENGTIRVYDGGWADLLQRRAELETPPEPPQPAKEPKPRPVPARPTDDPLPVLEQKIESQELLVATLEERLAADWGDAELVAAHGAAREELHRLLERWEKLLDGVS